MADNATAMSGAAAAIRAADPIDVLVIGAGPAGIAAATAAAEAGSRVLAIDDNPAPGGQIWRGGGAAGAAGAALRRLAACGAAVAPGTAVVSVGPGPAVVVRGPHGADERESLVRLAPRRVVLATGARERFVPFPGWTTPGVVGAGGLQALVKQGLDVAGRRVVVAGSGPLLLAVGELVVQRGGRLVAIAEQAGAWRLARFGAGLLAAPSKLAQALSLRRAIGPVLRPGCFPIAVRPAAAGLVVTLRAGGPGRERDTELACDILAAGFGLVPNTEVARALGCRIGAAGVWVDQWQRTSVGDVLAAGECTGVGGLEKSLVEGRRAGLVAAGREREADRLRAPAHRARRFAARLERTFALDPRLATLADDETIVCRCEDVAAGRLRGFTGWREAKLLSRVGMGPCQGRVCGTCTAVVFGWTCDDVRPPLVPVPVGSLSMAPER